MTTPRLTTPRLTTPRLTRACLASLASLAYVARPRAALPAQSRATMLHFKLAEVTMLPSPYARDRGKLIEHLTITPAGTTRLQGELPLAPAKGTRSAPPAQPPAETAA